jgi:hypothetical protein
MTWAGFAGWALLRPPLFAVDRVIAAWPAVTFSALMTLGMVTIAVARAGTAVAFARGGLGATLTLVAGTVLARASGYRRTLLARRDERERQEP